MAADKPAEVAGPRSVAVAPHRMAVVRFVDPQQVGSTTWGPRGRAGPGQGWIRVALRAYQVRSLGTHFNVGSAPNHTPRCLSPGDALVSQYEVDLIGSHPHKVRMNRGDLADEPDT